MFEQYIMYFSSVWPTRALEGKYIGASIYIYYGMFVYEDGCGVNPIQTSQRDNFLKCVKHILFFVPFELRALLSSLLAFSFIIDINIK